jgi:putative flippase GtrA
MNFPAAISRMRPADTLRAQAARYLVVGGVAFAVDYALLVLLTELAGVNYLASAVFAFVAGLAVNYVLCTKFVFAGRTLANRGVEFAVFAAIGVVGLGLTELILWCGEEVVGLDYRLAKFFAVAVVLAWNFGVRRALLFRGSSSPAGAAGL